MSSSRLQLDFTNIDFLMDGDPADIVLEPVAAPPGSSGEGATTTTTSSSNRPEKKRRRPALSCEQCRKRKIKCDRSVPCTNCTKSHISPCTYAPTHVPAHRSRKAAAAAAASRESGSEHSPAETSRRTAPGPGAAESTRTSRTFTANPFIAPSSVVRGVPVPAAASSSSSDSSNVDALVARVRELEAKLADNVQISKSAEDHIVENPDEQVAPMKGTVSKTRFFGQSHWMNSVDLFPSILRLMQRPENKKSESFKYFIKCKKMGKIIKEHRLKPLATSNLGQNIPQRELADQLVDIYFRTFEGVLRILHAPTFREEYDKYWQNPSAASDAFVMQLQLCMAIGASMYDDLYSLRLTAMQWVHEAQIWLLLPPEKSKMTIAGLQIMCMLTIAKATCSIGQELTWITTGGLLRQAMYMGLHRDPKHLAKMTVYRAEMRRRLWATILELNIQSSSDAGGPPLISARHYDTQLPANLNDDQLTDEPESNSRTANPDELTDMSVQLALAQSLPLRLLIIEHVNEFRSSDAYSETLRYNSELNKACRALAQRLALFAALQKTSSRAVLTSFHSSYAQLLVYRCFISLHQPLIARSLKDPTYYYSRKVALDCSLKMTQICGLSAPRFPSAPPGSQDPCTAFDRLLTNGAGMLRSIPLQTTCSIALELVKKKEEERDSLPAVGCAELRAILDAAVLLAQRRISSGETNVKTYCFMAAYMALIESIEMDLPQEQIESQVLAAATAASTKSFELLKELARKEGAPYSDLADGETDALAMEGVQNLDSFIDTPFDWMSDDLGWDSMGGLSWSTASQGADMNQIMVPLF